MSHLQGLKVIAMPWYLALTGSIIVILVGIYKKLNIGLTMLLGAVALGIVAGLPAAQFLDVLVDGIWNNITIMLMVSILLLGVLGHILKATGAMEQIIVNLQALVSDIRIIAAATPMLIGMLTVPGGAILSAPLCAEAGNRLNAPPVLQAVINNWFRHVLYFMFPLFPSLIIASELSGVGLGRIFLHNLPLTVIGTLSGFFFLFRHYPKTVDDDNQTPAGQTGQEKSDLKQAIGYKKDDALQGDVLHNDTRYNDTTSADAESGKCLLRRAAMLVKSVLPLLVILVLVVFFNVYFPLALLAGIALALLNYLPTENRISALVERLRAMLLPGVKIPVVVVIAGIMVYKEMLAYTGVISDLTGTVLDLGLPVILLIAVISFLVGMLTGDNAASMAILVPLFLPLLPAGDPAYGAYLSFLYAGSTAGHIISPAHPCFALTKEYYGVEIRSFIGLTMPMLVAVMIAGMALTLLFGYH